MTSVTHSKALFDTLSDTSKHNVSQRKLLQCNGFGDFVTCDTLVPPYKGGGVSYVSRDTYEMGGTPLRFVTNYCNALCELIYTYFIKFSMCHNVSQNFSENRLNPLHRNGFSDLRCKCQCVTQCVTPLKSIY